MKKYSFTYSRPHQRVWVGVFRFKLLVCLLLLDWEVTEHGILMGCGAGHIGRCTGWLLKHVNQSINWVFTVLNWF